ncbi:MAG: YARHG domain-containing protein [Hyphomicrobium sp.]
MRRALVSALPIAALLFAAASPTGAEPAADYVCSIDTCKSLSLDTAPAAFDATARLDWSSSQIWNYIEEILQVAGLAPNFELIETDKVGNAAAMVRENKRILAYNPTWVASIGKSERWKMYGLLSHELGHHLQGHTLLPGGSQPPIELEADRYAGFVLARLGANSTEAISLWQTLSERGSDTHPARADRVAKVREGWTAGGGRESAARPKAPEEAEDYLFADSDRRRLSERDIADMPPAMLRVARNEIFARHGFVFKSPDLTEYFSKKRWYQPISRDVKLSAVETANVNFLKQREDSAGGEAIASGFLLPQSATQRLSVAELRGLSGKDLAIARNEIYARRGYIFNDKRLDAYFRSKPWYQPRSRNVKLSAREQENVDLIRSRE